MSDQTTFWPDQNYVGNIGRSIITAYYDPRRKLWRLLINGRETFFDPGSHEMLEWESEKEARDWFESMHGEK